MWTLPNIVTLARLLVLPLIVFLIWPGMESRATCVWAGLLYAMSSVFDVVDGVIARRTGQVTVAGKFLDPLADKLLYIITLLALLQLPGDRVPTWVVMLVVTRELVITGLRGVAAAEGIVIAAESGGKLKTALGTIGTCALLIHYPYVMNFGFTSALVDAYVIGIYVTFISLYFSITSGVGYIVGFIRALKLNPHDSPA